MGELSKRRHFLFLHADTRSPPTTRRYTRSKSLDSRIRRHLMVDIETSVTLSSAAQGEHSTRRDVDHRQAPEKGLVVPETAAQFTVLSPATPPILHELSVFEHEWGEDSFSAYGFTLMMVAGRNAMGSNCSTNTFWFPFAFRTSAFLHHYQRIFTSPDVLIPLYRRSARELRSLALERSLETIKCVGSRLSSSDIGSATSDGVLHAVLAMVCYNFASLDFDRAMIHVKGMWMVIVARGGISTLEANQDLMLMISWVDTTAALLHDTKPLFPSSALIANASVFRGSGLETLPPALLGIINDENTQDTRFMKVMYCIGDLNALAALVRSELATKGSAIWENGEQMGLLTNPVTHQLLDLPPGSEPLTRWEIYSEALRLGAILWIIRVKRRCRSYPGTAQARISRLLNILSNRPNAKHTWNSPGLRVVRLWLLVLCSISNPGDKDLATSIELIAGEMKEPRSTPWIEVMADIRQMPWVDIFEPPCAKLEQSLLEDHPRGTQGVRRVHR